MAKIRVGRRQVKPDAPAHTRGVPMGGSPGSYERMPGHLSNGTSTAERSTGIDAGARDPIDPDMPNLSPA